MAKCVRCGRGGMGVLHSAIKLNDGNYVCFKCYKELGYNPMKDITTAPRMISWDDIKDGKENEGARARAAAEARFDAAEAEKYRILPKHYHELYEAGATDNEIKIFAAISAILEDEGLDIEPLDISLAENGSLHVWLDGVMIIQYKSEPDVKWITFPHESYDKIRIGGVAKIRTSLAPKIIEAYKSAL